MTVSASGLSASGMSASGMSELSENGRDRRDGKDGGRWDTW